MKKYKIQNRIPKISHACVPLRLKKKTIVRAKKWLVDLKRKENMNLPELYYSLLRSVVSLVDKILSHYANKETEFLQ